MNQPNSAGPFSGWQLSLLPVRRLVLLGTIALAVPGCVETGDRGPEELSASLEAVQIWAHPDTVGISVYAPLDFKAASRTTVWAIGEMFRGVMRYKPEEDIQEVFGFEDFPPVEVVKPARLAIAENAGIFVYDDSTRMLDLYSPDGQHLRGFAPGLRPSILEVSRHPLRLTYGVRAFADDTIPTLAVVQTDFLGRNVDTLLSPHAGPEALRHAPAVSGSLVSTQAVSGLWILAKTLSDTVFEVSGSGPARKLVLPEPDTLRVGVLADLQQQILWVATPRPSGGLDYEAYDISLEGEDGVIDGRQAYLGARTTPLGFSARVAFDGSVSGWWREDRRTFTPRGYDMRIDELRRGAAAARGSRAAWRAENAGAWARAVQEEEARQELEEPRQEAEKE